MKKRLYTAEAIAILFGMIIGAGILGIPYVFAQAGLVWGLINLIGIGLIMLLVHLYLGEIVLRTKGKHQLPGYASIYLGKSGRILMLISMMFVQYGALIAYMFGEGEVLIFIFLGSSAVSFQILFSGIFFILMATLIFFGLKTLGKGELIGLGAIIAIIIAITIFFLPQAQLANLKTFNSLLFFRFFFPYGAILFAYLGFAAIPEMREILISKKAKTSMKKAIIIGSITPIIIYLIFTLTVFAYSGQATPEIATIALGRLVSLFAVFTMFTSFLAIGIAQKQIFWYDLKFTRLTAWFLTCVPVLIIGLAIIYFQLATFIQIISFSGAVAGGLGGILIVLMAIRAKKLGKRKPEYKIPINWFIAALLILLFAFGIIYYFIF